LFIASIGEAICLGQPHPGVIWTIFWSRQLHFEFENEFSRPPGATTFRGPDKAKGTIASRRLARIPARTIFFHASSPAIFLGHIAEAQMPSLAMSGTPPAFVVIDSSNHVAGKSTGFLLCRG